MVISGEQEMLCHVLLRMTKYAFVLSRPTEMSVLTMSMALCLKLQNKENACLSQLLERQTCHFFPFKLNTILPE